MERIEKHGYQVAKPLFDLIEQRVLPELDVNSADFWQGTCAIFDDLTPINQALLAKRETIQQAIDQWHAEHKGHPFDFKGYKSYLTDLGYIVPAVDDFKITTDKVDPEIATVAGPQLVVPVMNARFALNAANARWGSLYDALYGSDVISDEGGSAAGKEYNPVRGAKVQAYAKTFLNETLPLKAGQYEEVTGFSIANGTLVITLNSGQSTNLTDESAFIGYQGAENQPTSILLKHNGLHVDIQIDKANLVGQTDPAGIKDIVLESALTTIQDCEDSIAAVDAEDKTQVYSNWFGLMKGTLSETLSKNGRTITRSLNADRAYTGADGEDISLPGRSLMFVRNVGHLMTTDAILTANGDEVPEGILDGIITSLISMHDIKGLGKYTNSRHGSIYIVKPKMHGPEEVAFCNTLFERVERLLGLDANTIKMGIMDEERRTSVNLKACIKEAQHRVVFINTGFLDRTGDEIHTSMQAGPVVPKESMKDEKWISAYELNNVVVGLETGFQGKAQIGKGMWAIPDEMASMMANKTGHLKAGANCAWVPSPTAATLHAIHYHQISVNDIQNTMANEYYGDLQDDLITIPLLDDVTSLTADVMQRELDNNVQGLLGYVVRWVDQGVGCSKVPDIEDIARMEDRATLRISSQHVCNWLVHGLLTKEQVMESLKRMAKVVDEQNAGDSLYQPMFGNFETSIAFKAGCDLIFKGDVQPSGYTEPLLHQSRVLVKAQS